MLAKIPRQKRTKKLVDAELIKFCWMRDNIGDVWAAFMDVIAKATKCPARGAPKPRPRYLNLGHLQGSDHKHHESAAGNEQVFLK